MESNNEYHDPDYPEKPICVKEEKESIQETEEKIKQIVRREFTNELEVRESEVMLIDQRMTKARRYLHQIRYHVVKSYYLDQKLILTSSQIEDDVAAQTEPRARAEVATMLRESQPRIHPSVLKLVGKKSVDIEEILSSRTQRNKKRKDYLAMLKSKNYTTAADETLTLRPASSEKPPEPAPPEEPSTSHVWKVPKHLEPKVKNVVTLDEATRNKMKHRFRIIIGNTSKYAPAASRADRSTHKWLLYVRGPPRAPDLSRVLAAATVRLHASYAPHHTVRLEKPPFHISRRGWGEFPAKVELHFRLPEMNRPAVVEHTIKLDRNYTGLQTLGNNNFDCIRSQTSSWSLGAETIVDVWLYSTPEMLEFEYKEDADETQVPKQGVDVRTEPELPTAEVVVKQEPLEEPLDNLGNNKQTDSWLDFFSKDTTELNVDEMLVKNVTNKSPRNDKTNLDVPIIKQEPQEPLENNVDNCTEYIKASTKYTEELPSALTSQSPIKKRIMKYMDPTTRKIYYLEMDRSLDISKVQEIVINSKGSIKTAKISPMKSNGLRKVRKKKCGESLLKPEVKNQLKHDNKLERVDISHIENDHCYLGSQWISENRAQFNVPSVKEKVSMLEDLKSMVSKFSSARVIVSFLLKKIPLISAAASDLDYLKHFPFVVESEEKYWKLDFAKRRNIEWSRAKLINKILLEKYETEPSKAWRTKQILIYSRLHGHYPIRTDCAVRDTDSWNDLEASSFEANIREIYPNASDLSSLSIFSEREYLPFTENTVDISESDEEIDVVGGERVVRAKREAAPAADGLELLPEESEERRMRFLYIERKCADIGIELRVEDVGSGYSYSAVHAVLLSAMRSFAEDLVRSALAVKLSQARSAEPLPSIWVGASRGGGAGPRPQHVWAAARAEPRLRLLTRAALATRPAQHYSI